MREMLATQAEGAEFGSPELAVTGMPDLHTKIRREAQKAEGLKACRPRSLAHVSVSKRMSKIGREN